MKILLFVGAFLAGTLSALAQTATSDDATASGSKVGTGAESGINAPANVGPRTAPVDPANDAIATPPPEITPAAPSAPSAGTGVGSTTSPNPPGAGMTSEGAGTGR